MCAVCIAILRVTLEITIMFEVHVVFYSLFLHLASKQIGFVSAIKTYPARYPFSNSFSYYHKGVEGGGGGQNHTWEIVESGEWVCGKRSCVNTTDIHVYIMQMLFEVSTVNMGFCE